jgi:hypothetical protein
VQLAWELRDTPIKVNSAEPGYTATDLNQHRGTQTIPEGAAERTGVNTPGYRFQVRSRRGIIRNFRLLAALQSGGLSFACKGLPLLDRRHRGADEFDAPLYLTDFRFLRIADPSG